MHLSSIENMRRFVDEYVHPLPRPLSVLDVGSLSVNGDYRTLFDVPGIRYTGLDVEAGANVDVVAAHPYRWDELAAESFGVVVSGQAFEHVEFPWVTIGEIQRVLAPGGLLCLIVPSRGPEHRYPLDCWRYHPDGLRALAAWAGLQVIACVADESEYDDGGVSAVWGDVVLVAQKPQIAGLHRLRAGLTRRLVRRVGTRRAGLRRSLRA